MLAFALAVSVVALDQLSKWAIRSAAADLPFSLGPLHIELAFNSGIAFGRLSSGGWPVLLLVLCVTAIVLVFVLLAPARYRPALGLILGGAVGNLVDRFRFGGAVQDFIGVGFWPSFNVADAAITLGVAFLIFSVLRGTSKG